MMIRRFKYLLKAFLHIIICSQLIFYPTWSFSQNTEHIELDIAQSEQSANTLNQHIESLYNSVFGRPKPSQYYQNHPLDVYSLVEQKVHHYETGQRLLKPSFYNEELDQEKERKTKQREEEKKAGKEVSNPLKIYSETLKKDLITVEVLDSEGNVQEIINSSKKAKTFGFYPESYKAESAKTAYQFQIKYQGQIIHQFPNHIRWISFFGPYLVFMEPAQVYTSEKAFISFIDLNYFETAVGKTALPFFRIPVVVDAKSKINTLLNPEHIVQESAEEDRRVLKIQSGGKEYKITRSELDLLARAQQLAFSVTVSLIDIKRYEANIAPFIESVSQTVEQLAKEGVADMSKKDYTESYNILQEVISLQLKNRSSIGSPADSTGQYTNWRTAQFRLNHYKEDLNAEQKLSLETLNKHLEQDSLFQNAIAKVSENHVTKKSLGQKIKGFYIFLTLPRPLGAPKILEGLGKIAGAVQTNESFQHKSALVAEGLKQISANKKMRMTSLAFLAGTASLTASEGAQFYSSVFQWLGNWVDLLSNTWQTGTAFLGEGKLENAYFSESKKGPFLVGLSALMSTMVVLFILPHTLINFKKFLNYKKSKKAKDHEEKVNNFWNKWKERLAHPKESYQRLRADFIDFEQNTKNEFYNNLRNVELRKLGLPVEIQKTDGKTAQAVLLLNMRWLDLAEAYKGSSRNNIDLKIYSNQAPIITLQASPQILQRADTEKIKLILKPSEKETVTRTFVLLDGNLTELFKTDSDSFVLKEKLSARLTIKNKAGEIITSAEGVLSPVHFSEEDLERVQTALNEIKEEKAEKSFLRKIIRRAESNQKAMAKLIAFFRNLKQIDSVGKAMLHFFSYANWTNTFQFFIKIWNGWFIARSALIVAPVTGFKALFYEEYFNRINTQRHKATLFNGGYNLRVPKRFKGIGTLVDKTSGKTYLQALKSFEEQIIPIERQYIRASAEEAYYLALDMYMKEPKHKDQIGSIIRSGVVRSAGGKAEHGLEDDKLSNFQLNLSDASKKSRLFFELYQKMLFQESMKDFLTEKAGLSDLSFSEKEIKENVVNRLYKGEDINLEETESIQDVRKRVKEVSIRLNLNEETEKAMNSFYKKFFEKWAIRRERKAEKFLNPNKSMQMERYEISKQAQNDPEALARTTRAELAEMIIDKPIEIFFLFLILAGADYALLQVVQEERFSETALFHLSRVAVWQGFMANLFISILANSWYKVQMDSRLAAQGGFDKIPTMEDVKKRASALKWYWTQFTAKKNSFKKNYNYVWLVAYANFTAALPTFALIYWVTLGRFDADLFANGYIWIALGASALFYKMENGYEAFANFSLKELIKKGFDFKEKDKQLLSHPDILAYKMKRANQLRRNYNFLNAFFLNNLIENLMIIMGTIKSSAGSFGLVRQFSGFPFSFTGGTLTQYAANLFDIAERNGILPQSVAESCKNAFTNNRTDL